MEIMPLKKELYDRALKLGVTKIRLEFSGGSDEGYLGVDITVPDYTEVEQQLEADIEEWAWSVYSYSGAGDGSDYGDNITYDLVNKTATHEGWEMTVQYNPPYSEKFKIEE